MALSILVADDEPELADAIAEVLRGLGHSVSSAGDGRTALALANANEFHLVISDLVMPGMGGDELLATLRARNGPPCWLVLMTSMPQSSPRVQASGCDRYLGKPFDLQALEQLVNDCANSWAMRERVRLSNHS